MSRKNWGAIVSNSPAAWEKRTFGSIFTQRTERGRADLPLLSVTGENGIIPRNDVDRRDTSNADKSRYLTVKKGDVVYNTMRMWQGVSGVSVHDGITSPAYTVCEPIATLDRRFAGYLLKLPELVAEFHSRSQGIVDDTLSLKYPAFSQVPVALPPLSEQRRIAEILSSVDEAIAATRAVIEQTKMVKQGVLEQLLTLGIGHTRFKQTEIGEIPEGWEVVPLHQIAVVRTGLAKNKKEIVDQVELPYLRVANVQDGYVDLTNVQTIRVSRSQVERYRLMEGDVLMTEGGDYDKLGRGDVWNAAVDPCLHQNHVFAVRADSTKLIPEFLALLTASRGGKAYFQSCSKRTTNLASINSSQVKEFPVRLPTLAEQVEIVANSNIQQNYIKSHEADLQAKLNLKSALMSDLLTGRKRVHETLPLAAE